jgi:hypothetical protein
MALALRLVHNDFIYLFMGTVHVVSSPLRDLARGRRVWRKLTRRHGRHRHLDRGAIIAQLAWYHSESKKRPVGQDTY